MRHFLKNSWCSPLCRLHVYVCMCACTGLPQPIWIPIVFSRFAWFCRAWGRIFQEKKEQPSCKIVGSSCFSPPIPLLDYVMCIPSSQCVVLCFSTLISSYMYMFAGKSFQVEGTSDLEYMMKYWSHHCRVSSVFTPSSTQQLITSYCCVCECKVQLSGSTKFLPYISHISQGYARGSLWPVDAPGYKSNCISDIPYSRTL